MRFLVLTTLIISGIILTATILLMSPKGGIGFGIGGMNSNNEYGSKKSLEWRLKKIATIVGIIFVVASLFLPYTK